MSPARRFGMVHKVDDLPVFAKAQEFSTAVTETLRRSRLRRNSKVYDQIDDANESIGSNLDEGFEQSSDEGFARYLGYSKGSLAEVMRRLRRAGQQGLLADGDLGRLEEMAEPLGKMLGGFVKYLKKCGFKDRGSFRAHRPLK